MELKVWVDGIQRIVCGVTEKTTCQDIVIALAHATGQTGRFTLVEKWRDSDRLVGPEECPLAPWKTFGEYGGNVVYTLHRSNEYRAKQERLKGSRKQQDGSNSSRFIHENFSHKQNKAVVKRNFTISGPASSSSHPQQSKRQLSPHGTGSIDSAEDHSSLSSYSSCSPYSSFQGISNASQGQTQGHSPHYRKSLCNGVPEAYPAELYHKYSEEHVECKRQSDATIHHKENSHKTLHKDGRKTLSREDPHLQEKSKALNHGVQYQGSAGDQQHPNGTEFGVPSSSSPHNQTFVSQGISSRQFQNPKTNKYHNNNNLSAAPASAQMPKSINHVVSQKLLEKSNRSSNDTRDSSSKQKSKVRSLEEVELLQLVSKQAKQLQQCQNELNQMEPELKVWEKKDEIANSELKSINGIIQGLQDKVSRFIGEVESLEKGKWQEQLETEQKKNEELEKLLADMKMKVKTAEKDLEKNQKQIKELEKEVQNENENCVNQEGSPSQLSEEVTATEEGSTPIEQFSKDQAVEKVKEIQDLITTINATEELQLCKQEELTQIEQQIKEVNLELFKLVPLVKLEKEDLPIGESFSRSSSSRPFVSSINKPINTVRLLREVIQSHPEGQWV